MDASTDNVGVAGYNVYLTDIKVWSPIGTSYTYLGLTCGTTYTVAVEAYDAVGNTSSRPSITTSTLQCAPPPPPPSSTPPPPPPPTSTSTSTATATATSAATSWSAAARGVVDGGPNYYAQFSNPLSVAPTFFPIAVWGSYAHEVANVAEDKAVGINTYVWVADQSAGFMQNIRNAGPAGDSP